MNQICTKRGMPMAFVIVAVGVGIALASLSLEAGFGLRCVDDNYRRYKCGGWWQSPDCQTYYNQRANACLERNYVCCGLGAKKTYPGENPNDPALTVPPSW